MDNNLFLESNQLNQLNLKPRHIQARTHITSPAAYITMNVNNNYIVYTKIKAYRDLYRDYIVFSI